MNFIIKDCSNLDTTFQLCLYRAVISTPFATLRSQEYEREVTLFLLCLGDFVKKCLPPILHFFDLTLLNTFIFINNNIFFNNKVALKNVHTFVMRFLQVLIKLFCSFLEVAFKQPLFAEIDYYAVTKKKSSNIFCVV